MEKNEITILISTFAILLLLLGIALLFFYLLFKQNQKTNQLKIAALNEQLLETQIEIQEQILKNVSQEIHDNVGQVLSLAKLNLATFGEMANEADSRKLVTTKDLVSKAINDLRDLARSMHGEKIAEIGLQNAVDHELKILHNTGQVHTHLSTTGDSFKLEPQTQMVMFRIFQEALHNMIKHSKAKNIYLNFDYAAELFTLTLRDDGTGFNIEKLTSSKSGIGLKSMTERALLIGGKFSIDSSENNGTTVSVTISKENPQ
ncbi:MAG: sensor histidine kinase [Ferruginibacter sp.]